MDSIPSYEFHKIFDRTSRVVNLKNKLTVEEIDAELMRVRNSCKRLSERARARRLQVIYHQKEIAFDRLVEYRFAERVVSEARVDPHGRVALTLRYGHEEAKRRLLAQARARIQMKLIARRKSRP